MHAINSQVPSCLLAVVVAVLVLSFAAPRTESNGAVSAIGVTEAAAAAAAGSMAERPWSPHCQPTVFILGARKGGTTSLYNYLAAHPKFKPVVVGALRRQSAKREWRSKILFGFRCRQSLKFFFWCRFSQLLLLCTASAEAASSSFYFL